MKKVLLFSLILLSHFSFAQEKIKVNSGYITFNSNAIIEFKDLEIETKEVSFFNEKVQSKMSFPLTSIKKIVDEKGTTIYESSGKTPVVQSISNKDLDQNSESTKVYKTKEEELVYVSAGKIVMNNKSLNKQEIIDLFGSNKAITEKFLKGRGSASLGNIFLGGGIGLFIGGGINNLIGNGSGPGLLIVGLCASVIGIPIKLDGVKKIKDAVKEYNYMPKKVTFLEQSKLHFIASGNGIGLQFQF